MDRLIIFCSLILAASLLSANGSSDAVQKSELKEEIVHPYLVETRNGPVQGIIETSRNESITFVSFLGLRFASPVHRFEPPIPFIDKWTAPRKANKPGSMCPQFGEDGSLSEDEDCLFLNVHVPQSHLESREKKLPVIVWIHGGGFAFGDGFGYSPSYFMENEDVILVTVNYRLGAFGFLTMGDDILPANNGLRDQVMALEWLRANIAAFGGNEENIVIAGNSAGAASVHYLLMSPKAKGLFHKAIMQSGAFSFWSYSPDPVNLSEKLAIHLKCDLSTNGTLSANIKKCLKEKTVGEILIGQNEFYPRWPVANGISRFLPTAEESKSNDPFFSGDPNSFFTKGTGKSQSQYASKVPAIVGTTRSEGSTLFTASILVDPQLMEDLDTRWNHFAPKTFCFDSFYPPAKYHTISQKIRKYYFGQAQELSGDTLSVIYSDALFLLPVLAAAREMANAGMEVYPYQFSHAGNFSLRNAFNWAKMPGHVGHADELQYLFPHSMLGPPLNPGSIDEKFSRYFVKFWIHFAKNGKPADTFVADGEQLKWKPIKKAKTPENFDVLNILPKPKVKSLDHVDRLEFWQALTNSNIKKEKKTNKTEL